MNNHPELCILSQQYNPVAICLQETHISDVAKASLNGFTPYHKLDLSTIELLVVLLYSSEMMLYIAP